MNDKKDSKEKDLYYLEDLSDYKVADEYPDVRGWKVTDAENRDIGKVDGLLVSKSAERVVYLDVSVNESVLETGHDTYQTPASEGVHGFTDKEGEEHLILPIGLASLNEDDKIVCSTEVDRKTFSAAKRFKKGADIDREDEIQVLAVLAPAEKPAPGKDFYEGRSFKNIRENHKNQP